MKIFPSQSPHFPKTLEDFTLLSSMCPMWLWSAFQLERKEAKEIKSTADTTMHNSPEAILYLDIVFVFLLKFSIIRNANLI